MKFDKPLYGAMGYRSVNFSHRHFPAYFGGLLFDKDMNPRIDTEHTHGTGCTLASAIATGLAQGLKVAEAVPRARRYLRLAIVQNPGLGRGQGPVNHGVTVSPFDGG